MNSLIYWLGRILIALIQLLPLRWIAQLGRACGGLAFYLTARYRQVVLNNLTMCFGEETSPREIRELAKENFRRIGENYASAIKTASMSFEALRPHLEIVGFDTIPAPTPGSRSKNIIGAIGHFGNFELYARTQNVLPDYQFATTYRALKQPGADKLLQGLRGKGGCLFFERRTEGEKLRERLSRGGVVLGLLVDQSSRGARLPFMGHDCHTGLALAVFALRYHARVFDVICYRVGLAKWRIEWGREIPTHENGHPRPAAEIMRDVNLALERAVRRDPANWFWVHRRWKD
jgi:KDO2-lipid IV(A) lauroyltransferase